MDAIRAEIERKKNQLAKAKVVVSGAPELKSEGR